MDQYTPEVQAAHTVKTWPTPPGFKTVKEPGPVAARIWPFTVNDVRGMAFVDAIKAFVAVVSAVLAVEHALLAAESATEAAEDAEKAKSLAALTALGVAA